MSNTVTLKEPCAHCGAPLKVDPKYVQARATKRYCSGTCRTYAYMARRFGGQKNAGE